jgi:hypothetical protein
MRKYIHFNRADWLVDNDAVQTGELLQSSKSNEMRRVSGKLERIDETAVEYTAHHLTEQSLFFEKLTVAQLVKKFPAFKVHCMFRRARQWTLSLLFVLQSRITEEFKRLARLTKRVRNDGRTEQTNRILGLKVAILKKKKKERCDQLQ